MPTRLAVVKVWFVMAGMLCKGMLCEDEVRRIELPFFPLASFSDTDEAITEALTRELKDNTKSDSAKAAVKAFEAFLGLPGELLCRL